MRKSFFILLLFLSACVEEDKAPSYVISVDSMSRVLIDIHLAEAKVSVRNLPPDSSRLYYEVYHRRILKKYGLDKNRFIRSMQYYTSHPEVFDKIEEMVVDSLSLKEARGKLE